MNMPLPDAPRIHAAPAGQGAFLARRPTSENVSLAVGGTDRKGFPGVGVGQPFNSVARPIGNTASGISSPRDGGGSAGATVFHAPALHSSCNGSGKPPTPVLMVREAGPSMGHLCISSYSAGSPTANQGRRSSPLRAAAFGGR